MKEKIRKLLFEYSRNSRITTKELGKKIRTSQQSASYLKKQLIKKKIIQPTTMIDAVKLGYLNVLAGYNFLKPDFQTKKETIDELKQNSSIISLEEGKEGVDLIMIYSELNLSAFNKTHSDILNKFSKTIKTTFVFPIIVNHEYLKNYLVRKFDNTDIILSGDRMLRDLSKQEKNILNELIKNPDKKIIDISESLKISAKTAIHLKKQLEKKFIIKGYSAIFDNKKLGINRQLIFINISGEGIKEIDKFTDYARLNKNIVQFIKLIGPYQILVIAESLKELEIIKDIRANFPIEKYQIMKSEKIHKKQHLPTPL